MKHYRIKVTGYGGEVVFGPASLQQFEFWNDEERLQEAGFDDVSSALNEYMWDMEEWESNIPKTARFSKDWFETDDYGHFNGASYDTAYLSIEELSGDDNDAEAIRNVWQGEVTEFVKQFNATVEQEELDLDEETSKGSSYVFYAMSVEKGQFLEGTVSVDGELDLNKFKFVFYDLPNGDNVLDDVCYEDDSIDNWGGDTVGKAMYMEIWNW